jgi:hypothetical protein
MKAHLAEAMKVARFEERGLALGNSKEKAEERFQMHESRRKM